MNLTLRFVLCGAIVAVMALGAPQADAKGCLKGAVVGGLAGHMAGHGMLGAAGGCAVGHHMANKREQGVDQADKYSTNHDQPQRN